MTQSDVSKQTILVLVFLTILVSLLGGLAVMDQVSKVQQGNVDVSAEGSTSTQGKVILEVGGEPPEVTSQGKITLEIKDV